MRGSQVLMGVLAGLLMTISSVSLAGEEATEPPAGSVARNDGMERDRSRTDREMEHDERGSRVRPISGAALTIFGWQGIPPKDDGSDSSPRLVVPPSACTTVDWLNLFGVPRC